LNVFYLAPLTVLFARFFYRAYMRRTTGGSSKGRKTGKDIAQAARDAAHGVNREVDKVGKAAENGVGKVAHNVIDKANGHGRTSQ